MKRRYVTWDRIIILVALVGMGAFAGRCIAEIVPEKVFGAWLLGDDDAAGVEDSSRHNHAGDSTGAPQLVEGKFGSALDFDGLGDTVVVPHLGESFPTREVTIVVWAWVDAVWKNQELFSTTSAGGVRIAASLPLDNQVFWWFGGAWIAPLFREVWVEEWVHFTFQNSAREKFMAFYVNGEKTARHRSVFGEYVPTDEVFHIGGRPDQSFEGLIDEFAVFGSILDVKDILKIMESGLERAVLGRPVVPTARAAVTWGALKAERQ